MPLIDENSARGVFATRDESDAEAISRATRKSVSNIRINVADGIVHLRVTNGDHLAREASDHNLDLPPAPEILVHC